MIKIELSPAQALGLLRLAEHGLHHEPEKLFIHGRRMNAAIRGVDRLRNAAHGHEASELGLVADTLLDLLESLRSPKLVEHFLDRAGELVEALEVVVGLEAQRLSAARNGQMGVVVEIDRLLDSVAVYNNPSG